jgi:hypothetical protein
MGVEMSLVGDTERDRAAASLRRHYLHGRLSADELSERVHVALHARSTRDLRVALRDLPPAWRTIQELTAPATRVAERAVTFLALAAVWSFLSVFLLAAFVVVSLVAGGSATTALVFVAAWLLASWALTRVWRRGAR